MVRIDRCHRTAGQRHTVHSRTDGPRPGSSSQIVRLPLARRDRALGVLEQRPPDRRRHNSDPRMPVSSSGGRLQIAAQIAASVGFM
jgi:hypothetical protein